MYKKARTDIEMLGITRIEVKNSTICFTLLHPGLLIGRYGSNINALEKYFQTIFKLPLKISLEEDRVIQSLLPYKWDDFGQEDFEEGINK